MRRIMTAILATLRREEGAGTKSALLYTALVTLTFIATFGVLSGAVQTLMQSLATKITSITP